MRANEKEILYSLLKKTACYFHGYKPLSFSSDINFLDDEEISVNNESKEIQENIETKITQTITLTDINTKIKKCTRCKLARTRNNVVCGCGIPTSRILIIGEGPGFEEDKQGLPFVGKAGFLLDKMLSAISLDRKTNCYITNIVKCRPPENRDPYPDEQDACISFLEAQIQIIKPVIILCLGRISSHKLLDTTDSISNLHGKFYEYNHIPLMVTYHPSALLRNEELKRPTWEDLKLFRTKLKELAPAYDENFITK